MLLTLSNIYAINLMGRKKLWNERILLSLASEALGRVDAALRDGEVRLDLIREAIERELKRRKA